MDLNTHETMKYLDADERSRFVAFQTLFESDGWRLLKEYAEAKHAAAMQAAALANFWDHQRVATGARLAWGEVTNLETQFMNEFVALADERRLDTESSSESNDELV